MTSPCNREKKIPFTSIACYLFSYTCFAIYFSFYIFSIKKYFLQRPNYFKRLWRFIIEYWKGAVDCNLHSDAFMLSDVQKRYVCNSIIIIAQLMFIIWSLYLKNLILYLLRHFNKLELRLATPLKVSQQIQEWRLNARSPLNNSLSSLYCCIGMLIL